MIALSIALTVLGGMGLYAWHMYLSLRFPKANTPEQEWQQMKERVGKLELATFTKPQVTPANIMSRLGR